MLSLIYFILIAYGLTQILCYGTILKFIRPTKRFLEKEMEFINIAKNYEENVEDMYVDPEEEDTTELGEVPQKPRKGNVNVYQTAYGILYRV